MTEERKKILVFGDIMIDRYTYVGTERIAPEAPIPVWDVLREEFRLGGAANVAHNLKALGGDDVDVYLAGIVGHTDRRRISALGIETILCAGSETMVKHRFVEDSSSRYVFRVDSFKKFSGTAHITLCRAMDHFLRGHLFDAVVFSDYDKGTISRQSIELIPSCLKEGAPIVVDSKRIDLSIFRGATVLKLNEHEYSVQVSRGPYTNVESLFQYVVVTKGKEGAELRQSLPVIRNKRSDDNQIVVADANTYIINSEVFPSIAVSAKDVTGCGDTHTAAMTFSLLKNPGDPRSAVKFANACARSVVQKFGTSVVEDFTKPT